MLAPIAYLTCELKGRDLSSRLLIASHLLKLGYPVVVGQQWSMIVNLAMANAPKGAVLFKTSNKNQADLMTACATAGHVVIASDEECLPAAVGDYARTTDSVAVDACHKFLAISSAHRDALIAAYPRIKDKVIVAGTARVDLLRGARTPRPKKEDYILFNTSFGVTNSLWGDTKAGIDAWIGSGGHAPGPETNKLIDDRLAFEHSALVETQTLIDALLEKSSIDIVIRPHPGERSERWKERYGSNGRVSIVSRSDPMPWMQHARVMIHSESSTGVEAAILGARALNLSPTTAWGELLVVHEVNPTARSAREALDLIAAFLQGATWPAAARSLETLFPSGGSEETAKALASSLPSPAPLYIESWKLIKRLDVWKDKFTVTAEEVATLIPGPTITPLDDSLFLLTP